MGQFRTAEELMEHLKNQIVRYHAGEKDEFKKFRNPSSANSESNSDIDFSRFQMENQNNNRLWNVSAERPITSHRKWIGRFIVFGKKVVRKFLRWYVSETFQMQTNFNASVTRSINELSNLVITVHGLSKEKTADLKDQIQTIENTFEARIRELNDRIQVIEEAFEERIRELNDRFQMIRELNDRIQVIEEAFEERIRELNDRIQVIVETSKQQFENLSGQLQVLNEQIQSNVVDHQQLRSAESRVRDQLNVISEQLKSEINYLQYRLRKMKNQMGPVNVQEQKRTQAEIKEVNLSENFDYLHFENRFRGSMKDIKERQKPYLPYFIGKQNVLDIGCGRGEFVELLLENSVSCLGIDLNRDMVEFCQDRGLPVQYGDAIEYLKSVEDNHLGGIFMGQVIEHMEFSQILQLVELAYKKLQHGSYLIMESPNPLSLSIYYQTFYVDPTHVKPVHPYTIKYLVEVYGFRESELVYSSPIHPSLWLPRLEAPEDVVRNINEFNEGIRRLNELVYGNLDYAIIAKK